MNKFLSTTVFSAFMMSQSASAATLSITIPEINKPTGKLMVKVVNSQAAYDGKATATSAQMLEITEKGERELKFENLAAGTYAVMVMHDENGNGKLDSNMLGIPKEGYGFSNNPRVMRQPTFDEAKFEITKDDLKITIELN